VFRQVLLPVAGEYAPELVLVSAGFDAHGSDPLADMRVSSEGFARLTEVLLELAQASCPGRLVFALEGGYDREALSEGVASVLTSLLEDRPEAGPQAGQTADTATVRVIEAVRGALKPYWRSL
jgi:acetoin utilization deacetylase AcuC-like enzyme